MSNPSGQGNSLDNLTPNNLLPETQPGSDSYDAERPPSPPHPKHHPPVLQNGFQPYLKKTLSELFLTKLNVLMLLVPFSFISYYAEWSDGVTFIITLLALIPLAERISTVTEDFAKYANDTLGGLMNATMGNVTEMIVSIFALKHGLLRVVQVSLIGSVLSNMLLVLGTAFFVGGIGRKRQTYSKAAAITNTGLLTLSVLGILFPAVLDATHQNSGETGTLTLSRLTALLVLLVYFFLIYYQLKTHRYLFEDNKQMDPVESKVVEVENRLYVVERKLELREEDKSRNEEKGDEDEDDEEPLLGFYGALFWMGFFTVLIAFLSEFIVSAIEGAAASLGIPILFIGTILLPIVGNAAEHAAAIIFAYKNRMDLCLGIAIGSASQISLFVIPFTVIVAWMMGQPLSLDFHVFETAVLFMTVVLVTFCIQSGDSDWLKGAMLIMAYILVSAAFWIHKDPDPSEGV